MYNIFRDLFRRALPTQGNGTPPPPQLYLAVPTPPPSPPVIQYLPFPSPWILLSVIFGITVTSVATMVTVFILFVRPVLIAAQRAAETTEQAAKDMQITSDELEKTAIMIREDIPLTMQDLQRTAEEWELVGKQVNFVVASVVSSI